MKNQPEAVVRFPLHQTPALHLHRPSDTGTLLIKRHLARSPATWHTASVQALLDACPISIAISRLKDGRIVAINSAFLKAFVWTRKQVIGRTAIELGLWSEPNEQAQVLGQLRTQGFVRNWDTRLCTRSGQLRDVTLHARRTIWHSESVVLQFFAPCRHTQDRPDALARLAFYDELTNLPNRRLLMERLEQALVASERHQRHGAVLFIDLDNFKRINDTHGHQAGDTLLREAGQRLLHCVRRCDTAARLGGDEFVVLLEELSGGQAAAIAEAAKIAKKIITLINRPYQIGLGTWTCSASVGMALFLAHHESAAEVLERADRAMYQAKSEGKNRVSYLPSSRV